MVLRLDFLDNRSNSLSGLKSCFSLGAWYVLQLKTSMLERLEPDWDFNFDFYFNFVWGRGTPYVLNKSKFFSGGYGFSYYSTLKILTFLAGVFLNMGFDFSSWMTSRLVDVCDLWAEKTFIFWLGERAWYCWGGGDKDFWSLATLTLEISN